MQEPRLFDLGPEDVTLQAHREDDGSWTLRLAARAYGQSWGDQSWETFSRLTTAEMLDVVSCCVVQLPMKPLGVLGT